jgi:hypothetical protein
MNFVQPIRLMVVGAISASRHHVGTAALPKCPGSVAKTDGFNLKFRRAMISIVLFRTTAV